MAGSRTQLEELVAEDIEKTGGIMVPVRTLMMERLFVKKVSPGKLHPNPDDEFCSPRVGPNYRIITDYERQFRNDGEMRVRTSDDRLQVQKVHPDGYMILNGHHRWAAAMRVGFKKIPVSIINLTQETDIEAMLRNSQHDRRVTLDLDEVIFCAEGEPQEKPRHFFFNPLRHERVRLGIPALLHFLAKEGYDIWIYTAGYLSFDDLGNYLKKYAVRVDGIVTGTALKTKTAAGNRQKIEQMIDARYRETVHIDSRMVLRTLHETKEFEEYALGEDTAGWSGDVINIVKGFKKD